MPVVLREAASKICSATRVCRSSSTNKLDDAVGLIKDLRNRIMRLNKYDSSTKDKPVCIDLSEQHGKIEGTILKPNENDAITASKTCNRLHNAIQQLGDNQATRQAFPDREDNLFKEGEGIPKELHFLLEIATQTGEKPKEGSTSADVLQKCSESLKSFGRKVTNALNVGQVLDIKRRINHDTMHSDKQLFKHLNERNGPPASAVKNPQTGEYISDMKGQHELMISQWMSIFAMHKDSPPDWENFKRLYGHFEPGVKDRNMEMPSGADLHRRARTAKEDV
jgi:hypothetical protein